MFDTLSERLGGIFDGLTGRGALSEKDVNAALREIRVALLEADVALPVVKDFIDGVRSRAVGEEVIRSVKPGQQVIKIVYDALVDMLGGEEADTSLRIDSPPAIIMMAGLQGSGKTTTTGKLAKRLSEKERKRVLLASLDTRRPAAMEQLAILADQCNENVSALPIIQGQLPADIARRALNAAKISGYDVLILDTAGRTTIDEQMMNEVAEIAQIGGLPLTLKLEPLYVAVKENNPVQKVVCDFGLGLNRFAEIFFQFLETRPHFVDSGDQGIRLVYELLPNGSLGRSCGQCGPAL